MARNPFTTGFDDIDGITIEEPGEQPTIPNQGEHDTTVQGESTDTGPIHGEPTDTRPQVPVGQLIQYLEFPS